MDGTIIGQGVFNARFNGVNPNPGNAEDQAGDAVIVAIPSNADWMCVRNYTKFGQAGNNSAFFQGVADAFIGIEFFWQRGMAPGTGIVKYKANGAATLEADTLVSGGFTLFDPSGQSLGAAPLLGPAVAVTAVTNATRPVVSTANTAGIQVGTVVRLSNTAQTDVNGVDMVVSAVTTNTNFTLLFASNALATAPGVIGGAGFYRIVNVDSLFYPRRRVVTDITRAVNAVVSTAIAHGMTPGQEIRFSIPSVSGMIQLNSTPANNYLTATVLTVIDDFSFTIDVDTTGFTAFTWPTAVPSQTPVTFPQFDPVGENTAASLTLLGAQVPTIAGQQIFNTNTGILADSTVNTGVLGMILGSGGNGTELGTPITGPAGTVHFSAADVITATDQMFWVAGKSTFGGL